MQHGRPHKFQDATELQSKIDDYFNTTPADEVTITGLALHLDTSRETLMDYENGTWGANLTDEEQKSLSYTIKKAKLRVHNEYEKDLRRKGRGGDIFALKNFGWKDKQESEVYGKDGESLNANLTVRFVGEAKPKLNGDTDSEAV